MKVFMTTSTLINLDACSESRHVLFDIIQFCDARSEMIEVTVENCQLFLNEFKKCPIDLTSYAPLGPMSVLNYWDSICTWLTSWIYELSEKIEDQNYNGIGFRWFLRNKPEWEDTYSVLRNLPVEKRALLLCDLLTDKLSDCQT